MPSVRMNSAFDPVSGQEEQAGTFMISDTRSFTRPAAWEDAVLVVRAEAK